MAQNVGNAALRRGAFIGNAVSDVASIPAQYYANQDRQRLLDLHTSQVQQQMSLEQARANRENQVNARADTAQNAADMKEQALKGIISAGFAANPATFDLTAAVSKAHELGAEDLIPTVAAVHEKLQPKLTPNVDPEKNVIDPTGKVIVPATAARPKNESELAADAANPSSPTQAQSAAAVKMLKPAPAVTAEQDDARYRDIQARASQKLPVLPMEQAWADAYEKQKTLGVDKSASAAADRQSATIAAQTAQQKRGQDFEVLKTARADIQKNADTPYQSAQSAADELRGMVNAAKSGNKIAASEQALTTAAATIRGFGLNRINMAEIGMPAGAGSAADRVANFIGKWTEGQPVDAGLQKDMLQVADVLEKTARKKYEATHNGINKLYGTTIPQTFPAEPTAVTPSTSGMPSYADYLASKKK